MTMVDAMSRVGQIQAMLQQLSGLTTAAANPAASVVAAATTSSADDFATTLATALGAGGTAGATTGATTGASPVGTTAPGGTGVTGAAVTAAAQKYLGVPYVFGGEDASGMDCSGLVQRVYADVGIDVPRLVSGQMKIGTEVGSIANAQPGDLIVTGGGAHILIYAGNNKVIHAPYPGRTVCLVDAYMQDSDIDTIRRVVPSSSAVAGTATTNMFTAALSSFATGGTK